MNWDDRRQLGCSFSVSIDNQSEVASRPHHLSTICALGWFSFPSHNPILNHYCGNSKLTQNQHLGATSPYTSGGGGSVVVVGILWWYAIFRVCFDQPLVRALSALGLLKLLNPDACWNNNPDNGEWSHSFPSHEFDISQIPILLNISDS